MKNDQTYQVAPSAHHKDLGGASLAFGLGRADGWAHKNDVENYYFKGAYEQGRTLGIFERDQNKWHLKAMEDLLTTARAQEDQMLVTYLVNTLATMKAARKRYCEGGFNAV